MVEAYQLFIPKDKKDSKRQAAGDLVFTERGGNNRQNRARSKTCRRSTIVPLESSTNTVLTFSGD